MGIVILLPTHSHRGQASTDSTGYKSGRNLCREIPVLRSIRSTNSAGTPRLERVSQYQTWDCVVPIRSAKGFCPPATSHALRRASLDIAADYPFLGELQPKNLCVGNYLNFGKNGLMRDVDPRGFARRVNALLKRRNMSQSAAAKKLGIPQQSMQNVCAGNVKNPRFINELSQILQTTREWLLFEEGDEIVIPSNLRAKAIEVLSSIDDTKLLDAIDALNALKGHDLQKTAQKRKSRAKKQAA